MKFKKSFKNMVSYALVMAMGVAGLAGYQTKAVNAADDWGITKVEWSAAGDTGNQQCDVFYDFKEGYDKYSLYLEEVSDDNLARNYGANYVWAKGVSNGGKYDGVYNRVVDQNNATPYWNVGDKVTFILVAYDADLTEVDRDTIEVTVGENFKKAVTDIKVTVGEQQYDTQWKNYSVSVTTPDVDGATAYSFYIDAINDESIATAPDGFKFNKTGQHAGIPVAVPVGTHTIYAVAYDADGNVLLQGSKEVTIVEDAEKPTEKPTEPENPVTGGYISIGTAGAIGTTDTVAYSYKIAKTSGVKETGLVKIIMDHSENDRLVLWGAGIMSIKVVSADFSTAKILVNGNEVTNLGTEAQVAAAEIFNNDAYNTIRIEYEDEFIEYSLKVGNPVDVEVTAPTILGFQMNTDTTGVAANGPSFRVVSSVSNTQGIKYGTVIANGAAVSADDATVEKAEGNSNIIVVEATAAGIVSAPTGYADENTYYALTMRDNGVTPAALKATYVVRAYVEVNGEYTYSEPVTISINNVAESLYTKNMMATEAAHNYLYNNVLNVVHVNDNVSKVFGALKTKLDDETLYNSVGATIFNGLKTYTQDYQGGNRVAPAFGTLDNAVSFDMDAWLAEQGLYYTVTPFAGSANLVG